MNRIDAPICSLDLLARIAPGYPFRSAIDELPAGETAAIQMRDVERDGEIDWPSLTYVALPSARPPALLASGDILFTTRGRRHAALALTDVSVPAVCSPHFFVVSVRDPQVLDPRFLAWQLNQRPTQDYFQREATGSYILNVTRAVIEAVEIVAPPAAIQRAILALDTAARAERSALAGLVDARNRQMEAIALRLLLSSEGP